MDNERQQGLGAGNRFAARNRSQAAPDSERASHSGGRFGIQPGGSGGYVVDRVAVELNGTIATDGVDTPGVIARSGVKTTCSSPARIVLTVIGIDRVR